MVQILPPGINPGEAGEQLYSFNQRNLLSQYQVGAGSSVYNTLAEYIYDGGSNRLQQIDSSSTTPITTTYTNDNAGLSQVLVSNDGTTTTLNLFGLDLIQQDDGSQTRTLLVDGLGSARVEMVGNTVETTTTYEPYGKLLVQNGNSGTTYGYTGEQYDTATSLVYLRARYYNPNLKVFLSHDPFPGYVSDSGSQNGYSYVGNNPVNFIDPSGLYKREVHYDLTYQTALEVLGSKCGGLGSRTCVPNFWIAQEIAWANQNMDGLKLLAAPYRNIDLHFVELTKVQQSLRRAISMNNPTYFGAALHQYQDWWSHVYEGYGGGLGHGPATFKAESRHRGLRGDLIVEFYITVIPDWAVYEDGVEETRASLNYLGANLSGLTESQLMDVWLREKTEPRSAERTHFGYDTDAYYPFTGRDKAMERGTRRWIERFFSGTVSNYPPADRQNQCDLSSSLPIQGIYSRPSNNDIASFLRTIQ